MEEKELWVEKSELEKIRIARSEFKGKDLVDIRTYFQAAEGEWHPTKKGINLSYEKISELIGALSQL